jgi:YD repeat-containing protein
MATSSLFDQGKKVCVICLCLLMAFPVPPDVLAATLTVDELLGKESLDTSRVSIPVRQPKSEPPIRLEKSTLTRPVERSVPSPDSTVLETDSLNSQEISIEAPAEVTMATSSASSLGSETLSQMSVNHFHVDPISGGGSLALPIVSPIGRGGMKPDLVLSYSPRRGNGPFGTGWDIDFGFIERSTKNGIPKFDDTDTFLCSLGGSAAELVSVGNGRYQSKVEGEFLFIKKDGDTWMVKDRKGRTYFFGLNDVLQDESVVKDGAKIFRWRLSEVRDVSGNFYFIRYLKNGAFEIFYTGEPGTDRAGIDTTSQNFYARITVELENTLRPDRLLNYRSGFEQRMDKRIKAINVYAIGHLQNRYVFDYETSSRSGVSLLKSVTFYGADGETTMPPAIFSYEQNSVGYNLVGIMDNPTTGDRRWSFRYNAGYDRGHENYGPVPPAHMLPLSSPIVAASWSKAGSWTQDNYGRINLNGRPDTGYYFSTYFYVRNSTTINLSYDAYQWNPGFWLNGNYSKTVGAKWSLKPGYNLLEYTDYHQHDYFTSKLLTKISDQVDLMNSAQVILPQLSGDFNGDGVADVATFFPESGKVKVALSTGGAFLPKEEWVSGLPSDSRPILGDFNGDGRIDIAFVYPSNGNVEVALSDGTQFIRSGIWIFGFSVNDPVSAGDFNGDGYADIVSFFISGSDQKAKIAMNTRSGAFTLLSGINPVAGAQADTVFMTDFNGDGLADFGSFNKSTGAWRAYLNTGGPDKSFLRLADVAGFGTSKIMAVADFNGDGMTDVGYFDVSLKKVFYRVSRSDQFSGTQELPVTFSFVTEDVQLQTGDFNGDGITDYILYNQIGNSEIAYSQGVPADLLTQVDNGIGGVTSIAYAPSKVFENAYMPFVIPVVVATTISNSRSYQVTTRYWYEGGLWKPEDREFYGFKTVRIYNAEDHYIQTRFSQEDLYLRGRPVEKAFFTKDGVMMQKTLHQWEKQKLSGSGETEVQFVYVKRLDQFEYDEHGQQKRRAVEYFYDEPLQLGNMTRMKDCGEVDPATGADIGQDARWTDVQYANRTDDQYWMIGFPREKLEYSYGKAGHNRKTMFFYDGLNGNIGTHGTLIAVWKFNEGFYDPSYTADFFDYDDYGNLIGIQIGGSRAEFVYDHDFHVFVIEQKDAEYQKTYRDYFGIGSTPFFGPDGFHGLFGQIKSETAVNETKTFYNYDTFGRLLSVIGPRDTQEFPTVQMQYNVFADYTRVIAEKRLEHGTSRVVRSVEFSDGLGQVIQTKNPSGKPGRYIISGEKEYDQLGRIQRQFIAREALTAQDQIEERPLGSAHVLFAYDALGRPLSAVNPDGTFSSYKYGLWETTAIDANGHLQKSYADAFGNIIKREEYRGADGRSVFYPKTPFQLYAVTQYFYNDRNQLTKTIDAHGNITEIFYDRLGNKIAIDDPDMGRWEYGYNESGDMVWQVDARGERTDFSYDNLHRLILKRNATDVNVTYMYKKKNVSCGFYSPINNDGMLCRIQYGDQPANDSVRFFYDDLGREIRTIKVIDGIEYRVDRGYDALNNLTEVHYPDGNAVYYYYDEAGRLERIANDPVMFDSAPALPSGSSSLSYHRPVRRFWDMLTCFYQDWFEPYILGISTASAQTTFQPAELVSPEISDVLTPGIMTFQWSQGAMADQYVLYVGSRSGWSDIYNGFGSDGLNLSAQVDIPIEKFGVQIIGEPIYARLWSRSGTTWKYFDYVFQSAESSLVYVDRCMSLGKAATQYYLTRSLSGNEVTANCMNITAPDVTLDCQGHSIINHQLKSAIINSNQNGTVVQNCVLESYLGTSGAEYETSIGILLRGHNGVIKKNTVRHAGSGIYVIGFNNLVEGNVVENTMKAIRLRDNNNTVKDNVTRNNTRGQGWGLEVWKGAGNQFINNKSYGNTYGMILSYADSTSVRCNAVSGNSIRDLYIYNASRNVSISGILPVTRYVSPDSSMTFSADACLDLDCVWEGDVCVKANAVPQVSVPLEKFVQSDQRMEFVAVATDADQDQLVIQEGSTGIPQGAFLETI